MEKQQQLREIELEMNENEEAGRTAQHRTLVAEDRWKESMRDLMNATWKRKELEKRKAALQAGIEAQFWGDRDFRDLDREFRVGIAGMNLPG